MDLEYLSKEERSTEKISGEVLSEIAKKLQGLQFGVVSIFVKEGYILGVEKRERTHFTSKLDS